ncbi:acetyl-CoA carboxylase, carboxyltransferase subunit beta [Actinokineospora iranica]|uniref:Multifunctional fusion protein n=1 Tax=Actinokineospora iranica TaxID=1271860 RepID=A0A1G6S6D8_9PSEU|nr:acetyl-CoA carboxylase, carboxyltransferase subunit beta [Actinokineospora iranica]SDD12254.1 acetyl-CoA carboxylase carboxyl transferase subunit beta [Actinokineospora iranica]
MTLTTDRATEADWVLCSGCRAAVYGKRMARNLHVCPECGLHRPVSARERLEQLADGGRYELLSFDVRNPDPLEFTDTVAYPDRLAKAQARTGMREAVLCARASIEDSPAIIAVLDFRFLGGSLGVAVGELITLAIETAIAERTPLVLVTSSGGARMQEGALSLMQMAKTSAALAELDKAGVLSVSVITDPTFGGVAASFATLADVLIAEPGARLGFAGRRVIEQTIHQVLPPDFQTAEFLLARGFLDMIVPRSRLRAELGKLLRTGTACPKEIDVESVESVVVTDPERLPESDPWSQVAKARDLRRPTALDYLGLAFTDFQELHGDRVSGECRALVGGLARLGGRPVLVLATQKGHTPAELVQRDFGMASPAGYRKSARLMRLADKLGLPIVTLVDTPGAFPGADAEERGQAVAIAENLRLMATLSVPVVSVIIGEGGSGGALALAVANRVLMFSDSVYSVISPEGCAAIIWKDPAAAPRAAQALRLNSRELLRLGVADGVLPEPPGGVGADPVRAADLLRAAVLGELGRLSALTGCELSADRRARFRQFGAAITVEAELLAIRERRSA